MQCAVRGIVKHQRDDMTEMTGDKQRSCHQQVRPGVPRQHSHQTGCGKGGSITSHLEYGRTIAGVQRTDLFRRNSAGALAQTGAGTVRAVD